MGCCGGGFSWRNQNQQAAPMPMQQGSPIDALKIRLAQGEITVEEYQKLLGVLQEDQMVRR